MYTVEIKGKNIDFVLLIDSQDALDLLEYVCQAIRQRKSREIERLKTHEWLKKPIVLFDTKTHYLRNGKPTKRPKLRI